MGDEGVVEYVNEFSYLGSTVADNGRVTSEVDRQIRLVSKAFGTLQKPVFDERPYY